jgi:hypothetical protein
MKGPTTKFQILGSIYIRREETFSSKRLAKTLLPKRLVKTFLPKRSNEMVFQEINTYHHQ